MRYVKFMPGRQLTFASRNKRELQAAEEMGYDIIVVSSDDSKKFNSDFPRYHLVGDNTIKLSYQMSRIVRMWYIIFVNPFHIASSLRHSMPDIVSCHDLNSLFYCWMSYLFIQHKPYMIYDSHEFEIGRNIKRNKLKTWWITHLERFLIKKCAFSIMVNDAIADEVQRIHKLKGRPVVVRSTPSLWETDPQVCQKMRAQLLQLIESPREMLLMYHGSVLRGRGIEKLIEVVSKVPYINAVILGNAETEAYLKSLQDMVKRYNVSDRIVFHKAVPIEELWKYLGAADVGMVTVPATSRSYYYMLPNKFFENIQSETPIICSDFPAVSGIVKEYGIGLLCDPSDTEGIIRCVDKMYRDRDFYNQCKENLKRAKKVLCWENEKEVFLNAFERYLSC